MKFLEIIKKMQHTDIRCIIDATDEYHLIFKFEGVIYNEIMHVDKEFGKINRCMMSAFDTIQDFTVLTLSKKEKVTMAQRFFSYVFAKQELLLNKETVAKSKPLDGAVDIDIDIDIDIDKDKDIDKTLWRLPTVKEMEHFLKLGKNPIKLNVWTKSIKNNVASIFGCDTGFNQKIDKSSGITSFVVITDGKHLVRIDGLYKFKEANELGINYIPNEKDFFNFKTSQKVIEKKAYKKAKSTNSVGRRRSTAKPSKSKFKTGVKYVSFHYSFGSQEQAPTDTRAFSIRAVLNPSMSNKVGIKIKDFECNDYGVINARFYIDSEIRRLGLEVPLYFTQSQYTFISQYGARMFVLSTGFKSDLDFDKAKLEIINRYYDVADDFIVKESFSKRLIVDHSPVLKTKELNQELLEAIQTI